MLPHADRDREGRGHRAADQPLVQPRQPGRRQRLPDVPARAGRRRGAELRRHARPSSARTSPPPARRSSTAPSTATTTTPTDNSARWPKYWDGRWFLQDFCNNSAKHGLLLDPATDQDGGKPVYADSLSGVLNWQNNYMDSKFGPDGALYVQVYDGFFTTGPGAGLYRFSYTGGAGHAEPRPAVEHHRRRRGRSSSRSAARAASRTSGTSATAARPRPSRARRTRTPRPARTAPS